MTAAPCVNPECGTTGGPVKQIKAGLVPIRVHGLCNACYMRQKRREKGIMPKPPKAPRRRRDPYVSPCAKPPRWLPTPEEIAASANAIKWENMRWMEASKISGEPHGYRVFRIAHPVLDGLLRQHSI